MGRQEVDKKEIATFSDPDEAPYPFVECVQTIFSVDGENAPLTPGIAIQYETPDMYGRPWVAIWERHFEEGMSKRQRPLDLDVYIEDLDAADVGSRQRHVSGVDER